MADKNETLKLIRMNEVEATEISWRWYPYIPFGKIAVIQGDPGDGKTTTVLAIAAANDGGHGFKSPSTYKQIKIASVGCYFYLVAGKGLSA